MSRCYLFSTQRKVPLITWSCFTSGQLSNVVISKAPRQIGGENSHATDPGKLKDSHFLHTENCDSISSFGRGSLSHATDPGKPKGSHFLETENRDCMPSADQVSNAGKASIGNHGSIPNKNEDARLAWTCTVNSRISLAYAAREDDPAPLVAVIFQAHKRIGYD